VPARSASRGRPARLLMDARSERRLTVALSLPVCSGVATGVFRP
jgi:hypothetical protein